MSPSTDLLITICQVVFVAFGLPVLIHRKARMPRITSLAFLFGYALLTLTFVDAGLILSSVISASGVGLYSCITVNRTERWFH